MEAGKGCGAHVNRQMVTVTGTHSHRIQLLEFWSLVTINIRFGELWLVVHECLGSRPWAT